MFKKQECKHCKLSKAVANDAAVQFNKANAELNDMKFHGALLAEENKRLNEEVKKWKHWWYLEKKMREEHGKLLAEVHHDAVRMCRNTANPTTVDYLGSFERLMQSETLGRPEIKVEPSTGDEGDFWRDHVEKALRVDTAPLCLCPIRKEGWVSYCSKHTDHDGEHESSAAST